MLFTKGDRLYVPKWGDIRRVILKECHDSKWAGHPGIKMTLALVEGTYYWLRMEDDVETFVRTCLICQQDKIEQKKSRGLLEPLSTPKGPWESVSMDFITCLPKSEGGGNIIVVVDRFSKYGTFKAAPPDVTADDTAKLFFKNV
ncbi:putative nucleotidyltransferase, ribonuclease H, partial [Tanacetum coccineum]